MQLVSSLYKKLVIFVLLLSIRYLTHPMKSIRRLKDLEPGKSNSEFILWLIYLEVGYLMLTD